MPKAPRVRAVLGTIHDYTQADVDVLKEYGETECKYMVIGFETCPTTDRPHLHTVMQLKRPVAITVLQKLCNPRVMDTKFPLRATDPTHKKFAPEYCKKGSQTKEEWNEDGKDGLHHGDHADFWETGEFVPDGHRSDLDKARDVALKSDSWGEVVRNSEIAETVSRNLNYVREVFNNKLPQPKTFQEINGFDCEMREWQKECLALVTSEPDNRSIHWYYDPRGGAGKTQLTKYLVCNHNAVTLNGKANDMFYSYDMQPIIICDIARSSESTDSKGETKFFCPYGALEKLKDGIFYSGKYAGAMKVRNKNAHVLVFSNTEPETGKWSEDRLVLHRLSEAEPVDLGPQFE